MNELRPTWPHAVLTAPDGEARIRALFGPAYTWITEAVRLRLAEPVPPADHGLAIQAAYEEFVRATAVVVIEKRAHGPRLPVAVMLRQERALDLFADAVESALEAKR